jgi:hypothetical protein
MTNARNSAWIVQSRSITVADHPRDASIERILRQRTGAAAPALSGGACVDGETLAAWTAGALQATEAATVEHHLADCARCQSMVAAYVRSEPPAPAAAAWRHRWQVRWLVPIATAATVAAIYVAIPDREVALLEYVNPQTKADAPASVPPAPVAEAPSAAERRAAPTDLLERRRDVQSATPPPARGAAQSDRFAAREERGAVTASGTPTKTEPAPIAPAPVAPAAPPPAVGALQETVTLRGAPTLTDQANPANVEIVSPDKTVRWRIANGRLVERSGSGTAQFAPVLMPAATVTAGHAPAASILWLVGPAGTIYLTTDGTRFERVPFAEPIDLASIVAIDDRQATVTTLDGRRFHTTDRGITWTPR